MSLADAAAAMESKFWGGYRVARAARINDGGSLTLISGFLSERPSATAVLQGAINAALEALARGLALELAPVRVNAVSPGMIETPIWDDLPREKRREMFESTAAELPVRKIGQPDDIAKAVLFLMTTNLRDRVHGSRGRRRGHSVGSRRRSCANRIQNEIHCFAQILPVRGGV